jgi:DNA primase
MISYKHKLLSLLEELLGSYKEYPKQHEVAFFCPACNHRKRKLQINLITGKYHCWTCETTNDMAGNSLYSLFKKVSATVEQYAKLSEILGNRRPITFDTKSQRQKTLFLPDEYISLIEENNSPYYRQAMFYLKKRGVTIDDIRRYNIGYAEYGEYKNRVIVPSYGETGRLNFFIARSFVEDEYMRYKMPSWDKNIIGFELFVNWNYPIIIVEGVFDALAIKRNAIPVFGKTIPDSLKLKIVNRNVRDIYLALDADAMQNSVKYAKKFINDGRNVYIVDLTDKDPSKLGFENMERLIYDTPKLTFADLVKYSLR